MTDMLEDFEGLEQKKDLDGAENISELSESCKSYLNECVEPGMTDVLVDRIDELSEDVPPKAIDSNKDIAELIEPIKDQIDSKCLEAPSDFEQVEMASDAMLEIPGTRYEEWQKMTMADRLDALQKIEDSIAEISHRPACKICAESMGERNFGCYDASSKTIRVNSDYLKSDIESYKESLNTIVHEGRHAYQDYNLTERQVHTSAGDLTNWRINENHYGYQSSQIYGFKLYWMQPVESDARKFAEDVFTKFQAKV